MQTFANWFKLPELKTNINFQHYIARKWLRIKVFNQIFLGCYNIVDLIHFSRNSKVDLDGESSLIIKGVDQKVNQKSARSRKKPVFDWMKKDD